MMDARSTLSRMPTPRARRPRRLTSLALAPAAALLVALVGCSGTPEIPDADPAPSAPPLFATEEEALEAATAVYEEFLAAVDSALANPNSGTDGLAEVASGSALELAIDDVETFQAEGLRITGPRALVSTDLQTVYPGPETEVILYACEDVAGVQLIAQDGTPISTEDRADRSIFEVVVVMTTSSRTVLERELWDGEGAC